MYQGKNEQQKEKQFHKKTHHNSRKSYGQIDQIFYSPFENEDNQGRHRVRIVEQICHGNRDKYNHHTINQKHEDKNNQEHTPLEAHTVFYFEVWTLACG